jgi:DNA-directed RNA polymerase specialized sigma24 family protein
VLFDNSYALRAFQEGIEHLQPADWSKLRAIVRTRMPDATGWSIVAQADDLIQEVVLRTLEGKRRYDPAISLIAFLIQGTKSIASGWHKSEDKYRSASQAEPSYAPQPEMELTKEEVFRRLWNRLKDDVVGRQVFALWWEGFTGREIQESLDIDGRAFDAARKRIFRLIKSLSPMRPA